MSKTASRQRFRAKEREEHMRLPNFVVIGAPKCGTTSLHYYLSQHPEVYVPKRKELHYFSYAHMHRFAAGPGDAHILKPLCATRQAYERHYEKVGKESAVGDISPSYLYYAEVSERIKTELGHPKIIVVLRDPIDKAFSQYMHLVRDNRETLSFYDALMAEKRHERDGWAALWRYSESSLYAAKLKRYLDDFGADQVKILLFAELSRNPQAVLRDIFHFLDIDPNFHPDTSAVLNKSGLPKSRALADFLVKPNVVTTVAKKLVPESISSTIRSALTNLNTGAKRQIDEKSRAYLGDYFAADVADVEKLLGRKLNWLQ
jgi:Sulfotransferase family